MHIPAVRLENHSQRDICEKATEIQIRQRYTEMAERRREIKTSLDGREGGALVEGVENFKYLGQNLGQTYDDWMAVRRNVKRS